MIGLRRGLLLRKWGVRASPLSSFGPKGTRIHRPVDYENEHYDELPGESESAVQKRIKKERIIRANKFLLYPDHRDGKYIC